MLQAGYLTITDYDQEYDRVKLDYPNFENREALETLILALYVNKDPVIISATVDQQFFDKNYFDNDKITIKIN